MYWSNELKLNISAYLDSTDPEREGSGFSDNRIRGAIFPLNGSQLEHI